MVQDAQADARFKDNPLVGTAAIGHICCPSGCNAALSVRLPDDGVCQDSYTVQCLSMAPMPAVLLCKSWQQHKA